MRFLVLLGNYRYFQINNFDANGYHPLKGWYPYELNRHVMEV